MWIAVCSAAPELLWVGFTIALSHSSVTDLIAAFLAGMILAFFVEPLTERVRDFAMRRASPRGRNIFFTAGLGLAFGLASVCLHDAIGAFVFRGSGEDPAVALSQGIHLTVSWAIVPFAIAVAWLSSRSGVWPSRIVCLLAALSPLLAAKLFSWSALETFTTMLPCVVILALGYRKMTAGDEQGLHACSRIVAVVGAAWLAFAAAFDTIFWLFGNAHVRLYSASNYWIDARFYFGWSLGLLLAPPPGTRGSASEAPL